MTSRAIVGNITVHSTPGSRMHRHTTYSVVGDITAYSTPTSVIWKRQRINVSVNLFSSTLSGVMSPTDPVAFTIPFFTSTIDGSFGINADFGFATPTLSGTMSSVDSGTSSIALFTSTMSGHMIVDGLMEANLSFFSSSMIGYTGMNAVLAAPTFGFSASATVPASATVTASFPMPSLTATMTRDNQMNGSFGFITTSLTRWDFNIPAPLFSLSCAVSETVSNAVAYVMNVHTQESTKYTNFSFLHIVNIGGKPYGVKSDGLYLLEGTTDYGVAINGSATTKETDFGSFKSKHAPTVYLNSDTLTTITPTVDSVAYPAYSSTFGGRKTVIARGIAGRYWRFKIDGIQQLEGVEFLPETRQKRVK